MWNRKLKPALRTTLPEQGEGTYMYGKCVCRSPVVICGVRSHGGGMGEGGVGEGGREVCMYVSSCRRQ